MINFFRKRKNIDFNNVHEIKKHCLDSKALVAITYKDVSIEFNMIANYLMLLEEFNLLDNFDEQYYKELKRLSLSKYNFLMSLEQKD